MGYLDGDLCSWLQLGPALAIADIWEVNQLIISLSLSLSLSLSSPPYLPLLYLPLPLPVYVCLCVCLSSKVNKLENYFHSLCKAE